MFTPLHTSILGRAEKAGLMEIREVDIRAYSKNKHHNTDDAPFGGGAGMVMLAQPIVDAVRDVQGDKKNVRRIYLSPRGETLTQKKAEELAQEDELILLCGHYEGVDQRALDLCIDEEISIGDYVLTGGEPAAMVVCDAVIRLQDGVILEQSHADDSFSDGLLEHPQYTKPAQFEGMGVPDVLLSGHHANIRRWRLKQSLERTLQRRPDLLEERAFSEEELSLIDELCLERSKNICGE